MKTKTLTLQSHIKKTKFNWVNSSIEPNFKAEPIRNTEYKVFHFDRFISSEDAIKEMEKEGYSAANISELVQYAIDNSEYTDFTVALGSVAEVHGPRDVPSLVRLGSRRQLDLYWFDYGWIGFFRFLAVRNSSAALSPSGSVSLALGHLVAAQEEITKAMKLLKS